MPSTVSSPLSPAWLCLALLLAPATGCSSASADDTNDAPETSGVCASGENVTTAPTPPLPGDVCADPPTPLTRAVQNALGGAQAQADARAATLLDPNRITVVACGSGSPISQDRAQACVAVFVNGRYLLFDAGDRAAPSLEALNLPITALDAVFLTHFHSDHIADLGEVVSRSWILGRRDAVPVFGGEGVERIVDGFNLVYAADEVYRREHHGETVFPPDAALPARAEVIDAPSPDGVVVFDEDGLVVRAFLVDHAPIAPSLGYRVEFGGRAIAISGDTIDTPGYRALAQGADVLVSEIIERGTTLEFACAFEAAGDDRNGKIFRDIRTYHVGVDAVGAAAAEAGVGTLLLLHAVPSVPAAQATALFVDPIDQVFDGEIILADDGTEVVVDLP